MKIKLIPYFAVVILCLCTSQARAGEWIRFPEHFRWCVATAAHQIEGYNSDSDMWDWEQTKGHIANDEKSGPATDHWNRVKEDIALMADLGVKTYRLSVEWAKVEPVQGHYNEQAIQHYRDEIKALKAAGIEPLITLHHFTFPRWVRAKGGWEWNGAVDAFAEYTKIVYTKIAPGARDWITINEPMVHLMEGYSDGVMPPGEKRDLKGLVPVLRGMLTAHARAYHLLHELAATAGFPVRVGVANHLRTMDPASKLNPLDYLVAHIVDQAWNWTFPDAIETGVLKMSFLWMVNHQEAIPGLKGTEDFLGVNYYSGDLIGFSFSKGYRIAQREGVKTTDMGWDIYPEGFHRILTTLHERYRSLPIMITENGIADKSDAQRPDFLRDHLKALSQSIREGVPVEGYCYWSLLDNFEWNKGFTPTFGLFKTDYSTFKRIPRPSAILFKQIATHNGFRDNSSPMLGLSARK